MLLPLMPHSPSKVRWSLALLGIICRIHAASPLVPNAPPGLALQISNQTPAMLSDGTPIRIFSVPQTPPPVSLGGPQWTSTSNQSAARDATYYCSHSSYGRPVTASCAYVYHVIPTSADVMTFGDRSAGSSWDVVLPYRLISREHLDHRGWRR